MRSTWAIKLINGNRRANCTTISSITNSGSTNVSSPAVRSRPFNTSAINNINGKNGCYHHYNLSYLKRYIGTAKNIQSISASSNRPRPFTSLHRSTINKRAFSQEASTVKKSSPSPPSETDNNQQGQQEEYVFQHPKAGDIFQKLSMLQLEEVQTVIDLMYEKLGVEITEADKLRAKGGSAAIADASAGGGVGEEAEEEEKEAKTHFDLKLSGFDAKSKIKVIKEVRAISGLGLKEAKELVEGVPKVVKKDLKLEEAEELKKKLEDIGATVELD